MFAGRTTPPCGHPSAEGEPCPLCFIFYKRSCANYWHWRRDSKLLHDLSQTTIITSGTFPSSGGVVADRGGSFFGGLVPFSSYYPVYIPLLRRGGGTPGWFLAVCSLRHRIYFMILTTTLPKNTALFASKTTPPYGHPSAGGESLYSVII